MSTENFGGSNHGTGNTKAGIDKMADKLGDKLGVDGGKIAEKLHNAVDTASERANEMADKARKSFSGWIRDLGAVMEQHPVATVLIGVSAGYVLAKYRNRG